MTRALYLMFIISTIIIIIMLHLGLWYKTPLVFTSYSTKKCMYIEMEGKQYNCDCLKDLNRYERIWVK